jgi:hypothetical protein
MSAQGLARGICPTPTGFREKGASGFGFPCPRNGPKSLPDARLRRCPPLPRVSDPAGGVGTRSPRRVLAKLSKSGVGNGISSYPPRFACQAPRAGIRVPARTGGAGEPARNASFSSFSSMPLRCGFRARNGAVAVVSISGRTLKGRLPSRPQNHTKGTTIPPTQ